jgi:hypothetical protein
VFIHWRRGVARVFLCAILSLATPLCAQPANKRDVSTHKAHSPTVSPLQAITPVLRSQGFYVSSLLQNEISRADVEAVRAAANGKFKVQVVALEQLPRGFSAAAVAQKLADAAHQNTSTVPFGSRTPLVIVVAGNQLAARGAGFSPAELDAICERAARVIDGGTYRAGLSQIVSTAAFLESQRRMRLWQMGGVAVSALLLAFFAFSRRSRKMSRRRIEENVALSA